MSYVLIKSALRTIRDLPTLPEVVARVNNVINDPEAGVGDLARVISADQSLTVKVLRLIRSAYYGSQKTQDIGQAISLMGFETVSQAVTTISICRMFDDDADGLFDRTEFWRHSVAVAVLSRTLARATQHASPADAFTCGLLHDVGKLILDQYLHTEMSKVLAYAVANETRFHEAEAATLRMDHTVIGEMFARSWGLPGDVVAAIRHHHCAAAHRKGLITDGRVVDVVRLADYLARDLGVGHAGDAGPPVWYDDMVARIEITPGDLRAIGEACVPEIDDVASHLEPLPRRDPAAARQRDINEANILELLGLEDMPDQRKQEAIELVFATIQDRISERVGAMLSTEHENQFRKMIMGGAAEETLTRFLQGKVANFDEIATEEILWFKRQMLEDV